MQTRSALPRTLYGIKTLKFGQWRRERERTSGKEEGREKAGGRKMGGGMREGEEREKKVSGMRKSMNVCLFIEEGD